MTAPLALTMGEPAGIGGEIVLEAWWRCRSGGPSFVAIDDPDRLRRLAQALGTTVAIREVADAAEAVDIFGEALPVLPLRLAAEPVLGRPDPRNAPMVIESIRRAVELARRGQASGVVTSPIAKQVLYAAGFRHPGHTEFLAELAGSAHPVMMLACSELRVVPVTIHVALAEAVRSLTRDAIVAAGRVTAAALRRDFGIAEPRLAVAALNPHGGEAGAMGDEEREIIAPAIAELRAEGIAATGPRPADTLFHPTARRRSDAVICMYHDQALIPLKTIDFERGVNVTLGLPFVRTSPDHGTAFDIAGKGIASPESMIAAIALAAEMAERRGAAAAH
jgi:4-hydroxythreonine-4-phosphate dehydrogenase